MIINELYEPTPHQFRSDKEDNTALKKDDTRKTRLTLDRLNRLRIMNDARKLEHEQKLEKVASQYKMPAAAAPGM
jgi:hypothetical protein